MQTQMAELIHIKLKGEIADLLRRVNLFWKDLSNFLVDTLGFTVNPYDWCVANKQINGKQCTIGWYVDDLKLSHVETEVLEDILSKLQQKWGKEAPLTVTRGKVHVYLGMTIDYSVDGQVTFKMSDFVDEIVKETPEDLTKGVSTTPAANHLFTTRDNAQPLSKDDAEMFHHLTAKLLYLGKRAQPDLQLTVSFLATRVQSPDIDNWK